MSCHTTVNGSSISQRLSRNRLPTKRLLRDRPQRPLEKEYSKTTSVTSTSSRQKPRYPLRSLNNGQQKSKRRTAYFEASSTSGESEDETTNSATEEETDRTYIGRMSASSSSEEEEEEEAEEAEAESGEDEHEEDEEEMPDIIEIDTEITTTPKKIKNNHRRGSASKNNSSVFADDRISEAGELPSTSTILLNDNVYDRTIKRLLLSNELTFYRYLLIEKAKQSPHIFQKQYIPSLIKLMNELDDELHSRQPKDQTCYLCKQGDNAH